MDLYDLSPSDLEAALIVHQMQHPRHHLPEILTAKENAARHLAADLARQVAEIHAILIRPSWGIESGEDEADVAEAAALAALAAHRLVHLFDRGTEELVDVLLPQQSRTHGWPFPLSVVLSVTTGHILAHPHRIKAMLHWMRRDSADLMDLELELGEVSGQIAADHCAAAILAAYPMLKGVTVDDQTRGDAARGTPPPGVVRFVNKVAKERNLKLNDKVAGDSDPWLLVHPLTTAERDAYVAAYHKARRD
jgi:hypothetical protein